MQKTQKNQNDIEKVEPSFDLEDFHLPKSYSYQDSVVRAPRKTYRSMEQDRESRRKPLYLWSLDCRQEC